LSIINQALSLWLTMQMVKWKAEQFRQIKESELSRRLAERSNVWLPTYFGNNVKDDDYYELQNHLRPEKFPDWAGLREQECFARAQALAGEKRFFHWELEFPEAFQGEWRGFDVKWPAAVPVGLARVS
jgi:hypothetical protein